MPKTVVGIFDNHSSAQEAAAQIKDAGLKTNDISILARESDAGDDHTETFTNSAPTNDNISDGVVTGTVLGGLAGLIVGIGTVIVPGLGVIAAAGPIVGLLSGAVTGGIVGGLVDLGIPEENSKQYESDIKSGKILLSIKVNDQNVDKVSSILKNCDAEKVETY